MAAILTGLQPGDVLFIDEIHRLNRAVEEVLYPAMEDYQIDIVIGKGPTARSVRLDLAALHPWAWRNDAHGSRPYRTTAGPVRLCRAAGALRPGGPRSQSSSGPGGSLAWSAINVWGDGDRPAFPGHATPSRDPTCCSRVRDFVEVRGAGRITLETAKEGCSVFGVDELGLDRLDRRLLEVLCVQYHGRPVGLGTLAVAVGEEPDTIEDVYEPYLLQAGFVIRTPRDGCRRPGLTFISAFPRPIRKKTRSPGSERPSRRSFPPWRAEGRIECGEGADPPQRTCKMTKSRRCCDYSAKRTDYKPTGCQCRSNSPAPSSRFQYVGFAATKAKTSSSSSSLFLIVLLIAFGAYFFIRPQRKRMRQQQADQRNVDVGDEIVTSSGIVGRIKSFNGDRAELEIAPGTTIEVLRQSIARRMQPPVPDAPVYPSAAQGGDSFASPAPSAPGEEANKDSAWWPSEEHKDGEEHTSGGTS